MGYRSIRSILHHMDKHVWKQYQLHGGGFMYGVLNRIQLRTSKTDAKNTYDISKRGEETNSAEYDTGISKYSSDDDIDDSKQRSEIAWLTKAVEPALQFCRWALPTGNGSESKPPPSSRSIAEIVASIQKSKIGIQDWSLSDLTIGLYLIYLRQTSANELEHVKGVQIFSEPVLQDLIYHLELARGSYRDTAAGLARQSMLRERNILKFVRHSSVMRPGYYIGIDPRKKLVILGIRGTHTVYDLVTDIVSTSDGDVTFEGYSTHFGTAEAARWFLNHEMGAIRNCLLKYEGYKLRVVGHSLGGAIASLLAIMLRKKSTKELGFDPDIVTAVGYATPPCVSKGLAESCCDYITTVVMQDDIVPRLSAASLARLRNEIIQTDWKSVLEKEDWKSIVEFLTNAKQVVSSVQDVARKVAEYAKFRGRTDASETPAHKELLEQTSVIKEDEKGCFTHEELFVPGSVYYLKKDVDEEASKGKELFTLWKRQPGQHFQRILLSSNLISAHKCETHYYALRDVIKGLPGTTGDSIF